MEIGTKVKHKEYGFEAVVTGGHFFPNNVTLEITKGENPFDKYSKEYVGNINNLEVIEEEKDAFEKILDDIFAGIGTNINTEPDVESDDEVELDDTFAVELEMNDGTIIRFDTVTDLIEFVEYMESKNK
jgi:hypothetical protein